MPLLWTGFKLKKSPERNIQDGLWQIGSQVCHILIQSTNNELETNQSSSDQILMFIPAEPPSKPSEIDKRKKSKSLSSTQFDTNPDDTDLDLWDSHFMIRGDHGSYLDNKQTKWGQRSWCKPSCIPITIILILIVLVVLLPLLEQTEKNQEYSQSACSHAEGTSCKISLVESIPEGMEYDPGSESYPTTYRTWLNLINMAKKSICIASYYWDLHYKNCTKPTKDTDIFQRLWYVSKEKNIKIRITQNMPPIRSDNERTECFTKENVAEVRSLNFETLIPLKAGIPHTKLWIVDDIHMFIGSPNMDWRTMNQVKEVSVVLYNCSCLVSDAMKIFEVYWYLGRENSLVPSKWPTELSTHYNKNSPLHMSLNNTISSVYMASSPPSICPDGRTKNSDAMLDVIETAKKYIYMCLPSFCPLILYDGKIKFWPDIDNALRKAAIDHHVKIRLLVNPSNQSSECTDKFVKSLTQIHASYSGVQIEMKYFIVPVNNVNITKHINHSKFMVTESSAYIGTSNWSEDNFVTTAGASIIIRQEERNGTQNFIQQLHDLFVRDWNSIYAYSPKFI